MKKYYPILVSKEGELKAIQHLEQNVKENVSPIFEVLPEVFLEGAIIKNEKKKEKEKEKNPEKPQKEKKEKPHVNKLLTTLVTHWSFEDNQVLLDFSHCKDILPTSIWTLLTTLNHNGVNIIPVVSQNSTADYLDLAMRYVIDNDKKICIRVYNSFGAFNNNIAIEGMVRYLNIPKSDTLLLLDAGYIEDEGSYKNTAHNTLQALGNIGNFSEWNGIIVSSGSFPKDLSDFAANEEPHSLIMHEWSLWQLLQQDATLKNVVKYSDYGVKHPIYSDVGFSGTVSIKYTSKSKGEFLVYRGKKSEDHSLGNSQYIIHARNLVSNTDHYSGEHFCWGDQQITDYSKRNPTVDLSQPKSKQKPKPGGGKEWVGITQNHHITLLHSLL